MVARNDKGSVRYRQFAGGYAQALDSQLRAVLTGYQRGLLRRNEVRVFAGRLEQSALHQASNVSLYRIINCQSQRKGNRPAKPQFTIGDSPPTISNHPDAPIV